MGSQQPQWPPFQIPQDCTQGICSAYCPQWCYFLFPPPPSLDSEDPSSGPSISPLGIALIALAAAAFILVGYYTVVYRHCRRVRHPHPHPHPTATDLPTPSDPPPSDGLDQALINKITVHRYRRGDGLVGGANCSVCLSEFRDDDSLRLLPLCNHAFHVPCIDKWLKSHPNCPLCRAGITWGGPPPQQPALTPEIELNEVVVAVRDSGTSAVSNGEAVPKRDQVNRVSVASSTTGASS